MAAGVADPVDCRSEQRAAEARTSGGGADEEGAEPDEVLDVAAVRCRAGSVELVTAVGAGVPRGRGDVPDGSPVDGCGPGVDGVAEVEEVADRERQWVAHGVPGQWLLLDQRLGQRRQVLREPRAYDMCHGHMVPVRTRGSK